MEIKLTEEETNSTQHYALQFEVETVVNAYR